MEVTRFLNVDLDIESAEDLHPLAEALSRSAMSLQCERLDEGKWRLCLELLRQPADAATAVMGFLDALALLPEDALRIWHNAISAALVQVHASTFCRRTARRKTFRTNRG